MVGRCFWVLVLVTLISDRGDCPLLNDRAGIGQVTVAFNTASYKGPSMPTRRTCMRRRAEFHFNLCPAGPDGSLHFIRV